MFEEGPEDHFVDDAVDGSSLFLILEESHLAGIDSQFQLSSIHNSNPNEIFGLGIRFYHQIYTVFSFQVKLQNFLTDVILAIEVIDICYWVDYFLFVLNLTYKD